MIVLNKVFTGRYLNKSLGHEVINLFKSDKGEYYIYMTALGLADENKYKLTL